jgi:hypothetical protein
MICRVPQCFVEVRVVCFVCVYICAHYVMHSLLKNCIENDNFYIYASIDLH